MELIRIHYQNSSGAHVLEVVINLSQAATKLAMLSLSSIEATACGGKGEDHRIVGEAFEKDGEWTWWCEEEGA